jgi:hypothetical protein
LYMLDERENPFVGGAPTNLVDLRAAAQAQAGRRTKRAIPAATGKKSARPTKRARG